MTASAQQLRITQSAVSQTITRLEQGVGTPLFDRSLRPLGITPAGRALYERARDLLAAARKLIDGVREGAQPPINQTPRQEERRVGQEGVRTCRYRGEPEH